MRRTFTVSVTVAAALTAGVFGIPAASAGSGDRPDNLAAAKHSAHAASNKWLSEKLSSSTDQDWFRFSMPTAGRALVTLGHLPRDYDLALYGPGGGRLASSKHFGRRFEQIYAALPAGDVYAQVVARSDVKPSVAYVLNFRPLDEAMLVAEERNVGDTAGFDIKGELLNNTSQWRDVRSVHVTWLDHNGNSVGTQQVGIIPGPVAPRKRVQFSVEQTNPPAGTTGYRLSIDDVTTSRRTPQHLKMTQGKNSETPTQRIYRGTITNTTSSTVRGLYPTVIEYDNRGRAIAFGFDHIKSLAAGETANYTAAINTDKLPRLNGAREFYSVTKP